MYEECNVLVRSPSRYKGVVNLKYIGVTLEVMLKDDFNMFKHSVVRFNMDGSVKDVTNYRQVPVSSAEESMLQQQYVKLLAENLDSHPDYFLALGESEDEDDFMRRVSRLASKDKRLDGLMDLVVGEEKVESKLEVSLDEEIPEEFKEVLQSAYVICKKVASTVPQDKYGVLVGLKAVNTFDLEKYIFA